MLYIVHVNSVLCFILPTCFSILSHVYNCSFPISVANGLTFSKHACSCGSRCSSGSESRRKSVLWCWPLPYRALLDERPLPGWGSFTRQGYGGFSLLFSAAVRDYCITCCWWVQIEHTATLGWLENDNFLQVPQHNGLLQRMSPLLKARRLLYAVLSTSMPPTTPSILVWWSPQGQFRLSCKLC